MLTFLTIGLVVVEFTLPVQKVLKIEMKCEPVEIPTEVVEPEGIDRNLLAEKIQHSNDLVSV